jgi:hypothetical protein
MGTLTMNSEQNTEKNNDGSSETDKGDRNSDEESHQTDTGISHVHLTPHKRAQYRSPDKCTYSRKKQRNPNVWKRNIRKQLRNQGLLNTQMKKEK